MTWALPVLTAIEEVCLGTLGSIRTVASGTLARGGYESQAEHEATRSLVKPTFEAWVSECKRAVGAVPMHSNISMLEVTVSVRTTWTTDHEILDDQRRAIRASALDTLESCRAALCRAGNLTATSAAVATQIRSGCLLDGAHKIEREDWRGRRLSYVSTYRCYVDAAQTPG